jgi:precorrin-6B methylase 2
MIEQRCELDMARAVAGSADAWETLRSLPAYPSYLQEVNMEYRGAELKRGDRIAFLGSGPLPITLILLYQEHGVEGIGIERNPQYAEMSQDIVNKLGLADHIKIIEGDHFSLPLREQCELLMLAYRAAPKEEIFAHLARTFEDGTKIAFRTVVEESSNGQQTPADLLYFIQRNSYFKSQSLPPEFREYRLIRPEPPVMNALLMTVKEGAKAATEEFVGAESV